MEIITTHTNADFDALASMVDARKFYPEDGLRRGLLSICAIICVLT
ncbi:MAG: hypothetical protein V1933_00070 [Candidatus Omnitrophota bacterium]